MTTKRLAIPPGQRLHPLRPQYLNASEAGAACGVDPYKSPLALWAEKTGQLPPFQGNALTRRGHWFECAAIVGAQDENPDWIIRYPLGLYFCDDTTGQGATPDAFAAIDGEIVNIQIKVVAGPEFTRSWANGPPEHVLAQVLQEGALTGVDRSMVIALVVNAYSAELHYYDVPRHAAAEQRLRDVAAAFWDRLARGERPPADVSRDAETVAAMFPISEPELALDLTGDNRLPDLLPTRAMLKREIASLEENVASIDTELKDKMGSAELAVLPGWRISWKTQHIAEQVRKATTRRPLLVTATDNPPNGEAVERYDHP